MTPEPEPDTTPLSENSDEPGVQPDLQLGIQLTEEEREVLTYLANSKRVDLRWLGEERKQKIRTVLDGLHNVKKFSLLKISKEIGRSYTLIWGLCRSLQIPTRNIAEADRESAASRSKHKRRSFDGTEDDRDYMLGFRNGDLTAWQVSGTAIMVTSSTTHPAFADLFHQLFDKYGPVYQYPMYDGERGYKWKLATRLDNSFQFLLTKSEEALRQCAADRTRFFSWLAGLVDADGHIGIANSSGYTRISLGIGSINYDFLDSIRQTLATFYYHVTGPYRSYDSGFTTPYGITYSKGMCYLYVQRTKEAQLLLTNLPNRHAEKIAQKDLAISIHLPCPWTDTARKFQEIKQGIRMQVSQFKEQAQREYLRRRERAGINPANTL
jgi:hypothetical protein